MIKHLRFFMLNLLVLVCAAVAAQSKTVSLTLSSSEKFGTASGSTLTQEEVTWTVTTKSGSIQNSYQTNYYGQQFGVSKTPWTGTFSTVDIPGTITNVEVAANTGGAADLSVKVGDTDFLCDEKTSVDVQKVSGNINTYEFIGSAQGEVVVSLNGTNKACYLGSIKVTYTEGNVGPSVVRTTLSFGEEVDGKTFIVREGQTFEGKTATVNPTDAAGTISYASDNAEVATVDAATGAVTLVALGKAKITATFTAGEGYLGSEASYTIDYRQAADPNVVLFDNAEGAFDSMKTNSGYPEDGEYAFVDLNGDSYTFTTHNAMCNYYGHGLQLKKVSSSDESAQGYVVSPTFEDKFEYGYRVTVNYEVGHEPELICLNYPTEVAVMDDANGTMYMDVPFYDGIFQLAGGQTAVTYIPSIRLTPLDKPAEPTALTFPEAEYNVFLGEEFKAPKATLKTELGAEIEGQQIIYFCDNEAVASVDENTGAVTLNSAGTANISAYFNGNAEYAASEAKYVLTVKEKPQLAEPGFYYEEPKLSTSLGTGKLTTKDMWFRNPNNIAVTFTSSDEEVATVDAEGTVMLKSTGEVVIKASFEGNETYKAGESSCTIVVIDNRNESHISFEQSEFTANMAETEWFRTSLNNERELSPILYTSSNPEVAEIGEAPETVKLLSVGETTITATFEGNMIYKPTTASYKLIVVNNPVNGINSISLSNVPADAKVYNLNGQSVNTKQLKKGVYVVNGKKVVLK